MEVPLEEIARRNNSVVIDTCVMIGMKGRLDEVRDVSLTYGNLHTDVDVLFELYHLTRYPSVTDHFNLAYTNENLFLLRNWFEGRAEDSGVLRFDKKCPFADVRLAALAFGLAEKGGSVAFVSSDKPLNELVYNVARQADMNFYPRAFPFLIKGDVEVYYFVPGSGEFVLYEEERKRFFRKFATTTCSAF